MDEIFFVDLDGNVIENKEYSSHIGLAKYILSNNKELLEEFNNSGYEREDLFLTEYIGYTLGVNTEYERFLIINKEKTTRVQKARDFEFVKDGFSYTFTESIESKQR